MGCLITGFITNSWELDAESISPCSLNWPPTKAVLMSSGKARGRKVGTGMGGGSRGTTVLKQSTHTHESLT